MPVLCNACGTRYRRTGALGVPGPRSLPVSPVSKLRAVPESPAPKKARLSDEATVVYALPPRV